MRIAVVGDLSQQDPQLLAKALDAALGAADLVVQVGDVNPGYQAVRDRLGTGKLLVIPGNHDIQGPGNWDHEFPLLPKQWRMDEPAVTLIGLDNSCDHFDADAYKQFLQPRPVRPDVPLFVFMHKALTKLVLPDDTESSHVMGEGGAIPNADAAQMIQTLKEHPNATMVCGHYHGHSLFMEDYGVVVLEGRGGAAGPGNLGYSLIAIHGERWTLHAVTL